MLAEKNGLRSVRRSPLKSALLLALVLFLTGILSLGVCIYTAIGSYLTQCDDYYHTVATLEYMGASYPETTVYDSMLEEHLQTGAVKPEALAALPGVMRYEASQSALGVIEGLERLDRLVYDPDAAVLVISDLIWDDNVCAYMGRVRECLYSREANTGKVVFLNSDWSVSPTDPQVFQFEETYIMSGRYIRGTNSYLHFEPEETGSLSERETYAQKAALMALRNNGLRVQMTGDLGSYLPFQRAELTLTAGRLFDEAEYTAGDRVCVISDRIAEYLGVSVGETVPLSLNYPAGGLFNVTDTAIAPAETYTVVGIYGETERYPDWVFVPIREDYTPADIPTGYTVGQFRLENDMAEEFYSLAVKDLPHGFRLTVYDQGYGVTATPYQELLRMARIFLLVCLLMAVAVLALFGYLFVTRQKESADTMLALGSGKGHVHRYFVAGALAIVLPAAVFGVLLSRWLEQEALGVLAAFAEQYQAQDLRFSILVLGQVRTLAFQPETGWWLYLFTALGMVLAVALTCVLFAALTMKKKRKIRKKRVISPKKAARSSRLSGWFKYAWLSIRRGRVRTASVVALALVAAAFLGQLTATPHAYQQQLADIRENTTITGYRANVDGLSMTGLTVEAEKVQALYDSGLLNSLDVSRRVSNYRFIGVRRNANGELQPLEEPHIPTNSFALETFLEQLEREPLWMATTSLRNAPDFYYAAEPEVEWLNGYDESCLVGTQAALCVLPSTLMEREGVELGSVIRVLARIRDPLATGQELRTVDFLVVGSYLPQDTKETMYTPFDYAFPAGESRVEVSLPVEGVDFPSTGEWNSYQAAMLGGQNADGICFLEDVEAGRRLFVALDGPNDLSPITQPNAGVCVISWPLYLEIQNSAGNFPGLAAQFGQVFLTVPDNTGAACTYRVIGYFERLPEDTIDIYCSPSNRLMEQGWDGYLDEEAPVSRLTWNSTVFTLKDVERLDELRGALEQNGFAAANQFGMVREYVILDDKDYISTVNGLERQIRYVGVLNTVLYVLTGLIAFAAAFLLLNSRKGEVAIMRGLGTPPRRILAVFLAEQAVLCALGCGVGIGLWTLGGGYVAALCGMLIVMFWLCWMAGTAVTACRLLRSKALAALSERE